MSTKEERRERLRRRTRERQSDGGAKSHYIELPEGVEYWYPDAAQKDKVTPLDFLCYPVTQKGHPDGIEVGDIWPVRPILVHYGVGAEKQNILCPKTWGEWPKGKTGSNAPCPICEEFARQAAIEENWNDKTLKENMKALKPKWRELFCVIAVDEDDSVVKLFEISAHSFGIALNQAIDEAEDDALIDFAEYEGGSTVLVRWRGSDIKKQNGDPILQVRTPDQIKFEEREDFDEEEWEEDIIKIDDCLVKMSYDQIQEMFLGVDSSDMEGYDADDKDEAPREKKSRKSKTRKSRSEEETVDESPTTEEAPEDSDVCIACEGSGKNTRGRTCRICGGTGEGTPVVDREEAEDREETEDKSEEKQRTRKRRSRRSR